MNSLLNHEEIKNENLLRYAKDHRFGLASYDLTVGSIYTIDGSKEIVKYKIEPQGMVLVVSEEEFQLPHHIIGYTTIRNSLSINGILAINIGLVDPGYSGPISTILMNFGRKDFPIKIRDPILRMTFHKFNKPTKIIKIGEKYERFGYEKVRRNTVRGSLENTFLNLERTSKKIRKEILREFKNFAVIVAAIFGALTFILASIDLLFNMLNNS